MKVLNQVDDEVVVETGPYVVLRETIEVELEAYAIEGGDAMREMLMQGWVVGV